MKTRIITALVCIPLMILVFLCLPIWGIGLVVGVICAGSARELLRCVFRECPKRVYASCMIIAFLMPVLYSLGYEGGTGFTFSLFFIMSCEFMASYIGKKKVNFEMVAVSILAGAVMPMMFGTLVRLGRIESIGRTLLFLPFIAAFPAMWAPTLWASSWADISWPRSCPPRKPWKGLWAAFCSAWYLPLSLV